MATYKVPQDVEADDKLIGPFSFRQFIYLLVVAAMIALAWALSRVFIVLAVIPVPVILLFGALALPLRKDQPMETYLAAMISFYLKPRTRLWDPDGVESLIEITVPHVQEVQRVKNLSQEDAQERFGYLANLVDTEGWAVRGQVMAPNTAMKTDSYLAAQQTEDVLDTSNSVAQSFNYMIAQEDAKRRQDLVAKMHAPAAVAPVNQFATPAQPTVSTPTFNPYGTMQQTVVQPLADDAAHQLQVAAPPVTQPAAPPVTPPTSTTAVSADIMNLANNTDLSIETIAREANRIHKKEEGTQDEFVVSFH